MVVAAAVTAVTH